MLNLLLGQETFVVNKEEDASGMSTEMPRSKYPKPLVFHDGRLALLPTPSVILAIFMWLPIAIPLAVIRIAMGIIFPYRVTVFIGALIGIRFAVGGPHTSTSDASTGSCRKGVLYVCTHRTLLDPVILCIALQRPVPAVTYSLSRMSEILAPMKTVRLTRDRKRDAATMRRLLCDGDLAVCPEGTTCREPYLLRFSSLFAELAENIVPVAMDVRVGMFYGTTASGQKWLDPVVFMLNPLPVYTVDILERVPPEMTCAGGWTATEVANRVQKQLADALGFECTTFTRRDKYMILAGNEGVVRNQCEGPEKKPPNLLAFTLSPCPAALVAATVATIENEREKHLVWGPVFIGRGDWRGKRAKKRPPPAMGLRRGRLSVGDAVRHQDFRRRGRGGRAKGDKGLPREWPSVATVGVVFSGLSFHSSGAVLSRAIETPRVAEPNRYQISIYDGPLMSIEFIWKDTNIYDAATAFRVFSPHRRHGDSGRSRTQKPEGSRSNRDSEEDQEGRSRTTRYGESEERRGEANKKKREQVESGRVARDPVSMFVNLFVFRAGKSWGFLRDGTPPGRSISRNFLIDHLIVHSPSQAGPHNSLPNHHAGT
ncbi:hypothetical protein B296_00025205 [Ensete ventricosum]|uniref:Phospholipid/glycerol acyltransferase domain-containing protein n=1 Tax=Ensete ventricosum TaxID=4639 RepID=A0A427AP93_ENSVE|nr:hypothetical protein B296_00025205 [Ensete ventricosum]